MTWFYVGMAVLALVFVAGLLEIAFDDTPDPRWSEPVPRRRAGFRR